MSQIALLNAHTITASDGAAADLLISPVTDASQPIFLCLPALGVAAKHYLPLASAIVSQGYGAAIFEYRGMGTSSVRASKGIDYGYDAIILEDLPNNLAFIKKHHPHNPIYLLGHSLGGQMGALMLSQKRYDIAGLICVAAGSPYYKLWPFPQNIGLWLAGYIVRAISAVKGYFPGREIGFAGRESRQVMKDWAFTVSTGNYQLGGQPFELDFTHLAHQSRGLMITIEQDLMAPPASANYLAKKLHPIEMTLIHLTKEVVGQKALGHFNWMNYPDPIVTTIQKWLASSPA